MANEAVLIWEQEQAIPFTCANAIGIEKGALLSMQDPMTASGSVTTGGILAGIAKTEKIASDGKTKISVYRKGIFKMYASGAINCGRAVSGVTTYTNYVIEAGVTCSGAAILGHALETAGNGETFLVAVNVGAGGNQIS